MCFKSGNYNPNVFIWMSLGMILFLLALHYNMVSAHNPETKLDYRINDSRLQNCSFGTFFVEHTGHLHNAVDKAMNSIHHLSGRYSSEFRDVNSKCAPTDDLKGIHLILFIHFSKY